MVDKDVKILLEWLLSELDNPCDITIHTKKAREDFRFFLFKVLNSEALK